MSCLLHLHSPYIHKVFIDWMFIVIALKMFQKNGILYILCRILDFDQERESWFIKNVDIMENWHQWEGRRGILRTK